MFNLNSHQGVKINSLIETCNHPGVFHQNSAESHTFLNMNNTDERNPSMTYPRVLYVGDSQIGYRQSAGIVLESMYAHFPSSHIIQYAEKDPALTPKGTLVYLRKFNESPLAIPFKACVLGILFINKIFKVKNFSHLSTVKNTNNTWMSNVFAFLTACADIAPVRLPRKTERLLTRLNPQVIHALIGDTRSMQRAIKISKRLEIPIVPFITDDWPSTIFLNNELGGRARKRSMRFFNELIERSPVLLVTGDLMAQEYSSRFQRKCFVAAPSVEPNEFNEKYQRKNDKLRLIGIGSPHIGRAELTSYVAKFAKRRDWEVAVYPVGKKQWQDLSSEVIVLDQVNPNEVASALCQADAILFVESLDSGIAAYTRLSVSGKLSQLIAAARPILAIGPEGQGSIEELRINADRVFLLHDVADSNLSAAFDYLEANLNVRPRMIPQQFLADHLRATVLKAFQEAILAWSQSKIT